jgi:hypothetical protein
VRVGGDAAGGYLADTVGGAMRVMVTDAAPPSSHGYLPSCVLFPALQITLRSINDAKSQFGSVKFQPGACTRVCVCVCGCGCVEAPLGVIGA